MGTNQEGAGLVRTMAEECVECRLCVRECAFLKRYGTPREIALEYASGKTGAEMPFACSLCTLCAAVCPVKLDPGAMFLALRREAVASGRADFRAQRALLAYERRGTSPLFSYYVLPDNCDTVFFPGCALSGTRAGRVVQAFDFLQQHFPAMGVVLDCCTKPSHDLGRHDYFQAMFGSLRRFLTSRGVRRVLVACPSCLNVFRRYAPGLESRTVYELFGETGVPGGAGKRDPAALVTVQDSCTARGETDLHRAVRGVLRACGVTCEEMKHHGERTFCCGEGGGVGFTVPEFAARWGERRRQEAGDRPVITYCAGCAAFLGRTGPTVHLLDLIFAPSRALAGTVPVARAPFTYLHRLLLKRRLRKRLGPDSRRRKR